MITRKAPSASISCARSTVRIPPPTWQGSRRKSDRTSARLSPCPIAASRSMICTSGYFAESLQPGFEVVKLQRLLFSLHQLDNLSAHQINRRNQHGHLMGIPAVCNSCLSSPIGVIPRWKMDAASAASACPSRKTSTKCSCCSRAARGDHGNVDRIHHRSRQFAIEAVAHAIAINRGKQ